MSDLRRAIVPIYLFHRYEIDAVSKSVGGVDFTYGVRGDNLHAPIRVDAARQRQALAAMLTALDPAELDLPDPLVQQLSAGFDGAPDRAFEVEQFGASKTPVFDLGDAADAVADITLADLLDASRLERVSQQAAADPSQLGLPELLDRTIAASFSTARVSSRRAMLRRRVQLRLIVRLADLLQDKQTQPAVKAQVRASLDGLGRQLQAQTAGDPSDLAQARYLSAILLNRSQDELAALVQADKARGVTPPPGMPIGDGGGEDCWLCEGLGANAPAQ